MRFFQYNTYKIAGKKKASSDACNFLYSEKALHGMQWPFSGYICSHSILLQSVY